MSLSINREDVVSSAQTVMMRNSVVSRPRISCLKYISLYGVKLACNTVQI